MPLEVQLAQWNETLVHDLLRFTPELLMCVGILGSLFARLFRRCDRVHLVPFAILLVVCGIAFTVSDNQASTIFNDLLHLDRFSTFLRAFLLIACALVLILGRITGLPDREDSADFVTLVLGGTLGMMLMVSANNLMMVFIAIEMASLPSYVLAGFQKQKSQSSEAALKYVVYGAAASGVMLYGISLLAGRCGSTNIHVLFVQTWSVLSTGSFDLPLAMGFLFLFVGLGFKLAVFPFQFWLPDVFTGALAEVGAILAIMSKAAAFGLLVRLLFTLFGRLPIVLPWETVAVALGVVAMLTATLGNIAALAQTNLKRLLAYSTIAHAGYMLMAMACLNTTGNAALLFYLVGYLPMTLGAFAVVAILRNQTGSEELEASRGLLQRAPWVAIPMSVFLFSLLGLPPFAGFAGKFQIFTAVYLTGASFRHPWLGTFFYVLLAVAVVNTVVSAGYYLKVLKAMAFDDPSQVDEKGHAIPLHEPTTSRVYLGLLAAALLVAGVIWNPISRVTWWASSGLGQ